MKVSVNPPKTPVTKGSKGIATATVPNVCKMPGPPAPFVPVPLPNIGKSSDSPKGYTKNVKVEGQTVAIKGATFNGCGSRTDQAARTTARRRCRSVSAIASVQRSLRRKARSWTMCSPECSCQRAPGRFILNAIRLLHVASTAPEPSGRPSALALA